MTEKPQDSSNFTQSKNRPVDPRGGNRSQTSRGTVIFLVLVSLLVGYVAGTRSDEMMARLGGLFGVETESRTLDLSSVQDVYRKLSANYDGELDADKLIDGASRGLVQAAGDEHTSFMDSAEAEEFDNGLSGSVSGIGAEIGVRNDVPTVIRVLANSPAEQAGVKAQDRIVQVNDTSTVRLDAARTAELIRGQAGTTVKLKLLRGDETVDYSITRAQVSDASVDSRVEGGVGIIKVRRFDRDTGDLARAAAENLLSRDVRGIVLDLRDNSGGYLEQAPQLAGLWLDGEVVVTERRGDRQTDQLRATGRPILAAVPTVVLVNGSSASASEIVAGALKDHGVAKVIGEQTYGKGSVQQLLRLSGGRMLKVTVARWYTPSGDSISDKGIKPDVEIELTSEDYNEGRDPQLKASIEELDN